MTTSISRAAYSDCFDLFDRALANPDGIRYRCPTHGKANHLKTRLHYARVLDRREKMEIYLPDDPSHGVSPYDSLVVSVAHDDQWVYIQPRTMEGEIEELGAAE